MTKRARCTTSSSSFGQRLHISRATSRHSPNRQGVGPTIPKSMTTLRMLSASAEKMRIKQSTPTEQLTRQRGGRRHNSSSPSSPTHGSKSSGIPRLYTLKSRKRPSFLTSKRGAWAVMPLTFGCCTTKCSAITSRSRASPSI